MLDVVVAICFLLASAQGGSSVIEAARASEWETLEQELRVAPSASKVDTSCDDCTALHYAARGNAPLSTFEALLKAYPEAPKAKKHDDNDRLPLHLAAKHNLNMPSITLLLNAYPEAADALDTRGKTPLTYAQMRGEHTGEMARLLTTPAILKKTEERMRKRKEAAAGENPQMAATLPHDEL